MINRLAILSLLLLALGAVTVAVSYRGSESRQAAALLDPITGPSATYERIADLQQVAAGVEPRPGTYLELGQVYLQKVRETGDSGYYARADEAFQRALEARPGDAEALIGAASVALARHDFQQALELATQATSASPDDPDAYGAMFDALVELGRYDEAVSALQHMADLRPDANSYARISYVRELHGDIAGAEEAMALAVNAAGPRGETAAWLRLQLGNLYYGEGRLDEAGAQYRSSLTAFPGYLHAVAALGRVAAAEEDYGEAALLYEKATQRLPVLEYVIALGDVHAAAGDDEAASQQYELVGAIDGLLKAGGVRTDMELALFYADHGDPQAAVDLARESYSGRPSVQGADALAWALFRAGMTDEALVYSREALRLGWSDNNALFHAAMIEAESGDKDVARRYLNQITDRNPNFSPLYASMAAGQLSELESLARR